MGDLTQAEKYLIDQIRAGNADGWSQLVDRYQGRLLAFAQKKLPRSAEAEDIVQEAFISFLKGIEKFREQAGLETYLFTILRRKIIDFFRGRKVTYCLLQDTCSIDDGNPWERVASAEPTASWYVRREEQHQVDRHSLSGALRRLIDGFKEKLNFRDLQVVEMIFFCRLGNKDIAGVIGLDEKQVALIKHRCLKQLQGSIAPKTSSGEETFELPDSLLSDVWQEERLSCLKRSTIGSYLLGTLDPAWREYVMFHLDRLGCQYCRANLEDLQQQTADSRRQALQQRIMQSTIGFLSRA